MIFFVKKMAVTASLQRPRRCHGALIAFYRVPTVFMVEILCALTELSLRVHGAHSAFAALSRRCHCVEDKVTSPRTPCSLRANATDDHGVCTTTLMCVHRAPIALKETLLRGYGDLTASPLRSIRTPSERRVTVFVLSMLKVRIVAQRSMRPHRVQWRCHCVAAVMLAFVLRAPRRSAIC